MNDNGAAEFGAAAFAARLTPEHREHLLSELGEQGLELALRAGARSIDADEAHAMGFRYRGWRGGGILLPFGGDFGQLRCDEPPTARDGTPVKYLNRAGTPQQPATFGTGEPTLATEGWKDALRLHMATGQAVQALPGVTAHRLMAPSVRTLIYDADAVFNPSVWGQLVAAGLQRPGLRLAFFPREVAGDKGGACEFFAAGGDLEAVRQWKARELLREIPGQWDKNLRVDWQAPAIRRLAVLAVRADLSRDAAGQLVTQAAKRIGLPVRRARHLLAAARPKKPPEPPPGLGAAIPRDDPPPERQAAEQLRRELDGRAVFFGGRFYRYDALAGFWTHWPRLEVETAALRVLMRLYDPGGENRPDYFGFGTDGQTKAAVNILARVLGPGPLRAEPPAVIVFGNGTFNLRTGRLEDHSPDHGATYAVDADYIPGAGCPAALRRVLDTCYPEGAEPIIRAEIRWVIDPTVRYGEAFHHLGDTGSGKGLVIEFLQGLLPASLQSTLGHPADIKDADKLYQHVRGRRLVVFPDTPARHRDAGHCGVFYELVENKPQTTRRLHSSEAEGARPMFARCILGSVAPLQFGDSRDGFLRRVLTVRTRPRTGDPDPTLKANLIGGRRARSEAVSWALAMARADLEDVLNKNDPAGLLRQGEAEAAAAGDSVSQFVDACLIPHPAGPSAEVDDFALGQMFETYVGFCRYAGFQHAMQRNNFMGQLRRVLGPGRCLPRRKESRAEARAAGRAPEQRINLPRLDAGFALRLGVLQPPGLGGPGDRSTFNRLALGTGGLEAIAALDPALRPPPSDSPETTPTGAGQQPPAGQSANRPPAFDPAGGPETGGWSQGRTQGGLRVVSGQSESPGSPTEPAVSADSEGWSHTSPLQSAIGEKEQEGPKKGGKACVSPIREERGPDSPETTPAPDLREAVLSAIDDAIGAGEPDPTSALLRRLPDHDPAAVMSAAAALGAFGTVSARVAAAQAAGARSVDEIARWAAEHRLELAKTEIRRTLRRAA